MEQMKIIEDYGKYFKRKFIDIRLLHTKDSMLSLDI